MATEQKTPKPELTAEEDAFLGYVRNMRNSVGRRFAKHLIEDSGFDAFEDFWMKLRDARWQKKPELELNDAEKNALAKALYASTRRDALRVLGGIGMCVAASLTARSGVRDITESEQKWGIAEKDQFHMGAIKLTLGAAAAGTGLYMMFKENEPTQGTVAMIADGENGEKNVTKLVRSLDALFKPIELSLDETGARRRL
ncbi:MAG: hypothetical protein EBV03_03360 [Proteobacteria bacterium]|nr:hypothetical protein [Pseudomonadota bacterium]